MTMRQCSWNRHRNLCKFIGKMLWMSWQQRYSSSDDCRWVWSNSSRVHHNENESTLASDTAWVKWTVKAALTDLTHRPAGQPGSLYGMLLAYLYSSSDLLYSLSTTDDAIAWSFFLLKSSILSLIRCHF